METGSVGEVDVDRSLKDRVLRVGLVEFVQVAVIAAFDPDQTAKVVADLYLVVASAWNADSVTPKRVVDDVPQRRMGRERLLCFSAEVRRPIVVLYSPGSSPSSSCERISCTSTLMTSALCGAGTIPS